MSQREFDYVVVGAGAAGAGLLYGILERFNSMGCNDLPFSIVVIERGGDEHDWRTLVPNRWCEASTTASASVTLLQTTIGSRCIGVPTGKGLGGTTNVNACLVAPPSREDFQFWPAPWNENIMFAVNELQDALLRHGTIHQFHTSVQGMLKIDVSIRSDGFWRETSFPSFVTCIPMSVERNGKRDFRRINFYDGLIGPVLKEYPQIAKKITWLHHTEVQRLIFDGQSVVGVECESADGAVFEIKARCEVILSAGAIESPALLLTSGVGLEEDLKTAGIPSRELNLPVGYNLRDHVLLPRLFIHWFTSYDLSPSSVQAFYNFKDGDNRFQIMLTGAASYPALVAQHVASWLRRRFDFSPKWLSDAINCCLYAIFRITRVLVWYVIVYTPAFYFFRHCCFVANVALLNPKSNGRIKIARRNRTSQECRRKDMCLDIQEVYLSDAKDVDAFRSAWTRIEELCSGWFEQGVELPVGCVKGRESFRMFTSEFSLPYYHWCGTCPFGNVVDHSLRVLGVRGLRVCDASVLPNLPSAPTSLTCAALGYVLSGILIEKDQRAVRSGNVISQKY